MIRASSSLRHRFAAVGAIALVGASLVGCSATNQITTSKPYSPSDGVRGQLGDVTAENLLVLTAAKGSTAALQGALTNRGTVPVTVSITSDTGPVGTVRLDAAQTVLLGGSQGQTLTFPSADAPGGLDTVTLATGSAGTLTVSVPVLDGTLPEYTALVPTSSAVPTPTGTVVATPAAK